MKRFIIALLCTLSIGQAIAHIGNITVCQATIGDGLACWREAQSGSKYCWAHQVPVPPGGDDLATGSQSVSIALNPSIEPSAAFVSAVEDLVQKATAMAGVDTTDPSHASLQTDLLNSLQSIASIPNALSEADLFKNSTIQQGVHGRTFVYCTANAVIDYLYCLQAFPYPQYPDRLKRCAGGVIFGWSQCMGLPPIHIQNIQWPF